LHSPAAPEVAEDESERVEENKEYETLLQFKRESDLIIQRLGEDPEKVKAINLLHSEDADEEEKKVEQLQEESNDVLILKQKVEQLNLELDASEILLKSNRNQMGAVKSQKRNALFVIILVASVGLSFLFSPGANEAVIVEEQMQKPIEMEQTFEFLEVEMEEDSCAVVDTEQACSCSTEIQPSNQQVEKTILKSVMAAPDMIDDTDLWLHGWF